MAPNEESLILVLKKVRHPLFRAAWTRKLVEEFEQLFPRVKLSGRTFRLIIDKCVTPAAPSSANEPEALFPSEPTAASESRERIVASGRRGRRLRQEATRPSPSTGAAPTLAVASAGRGPIVKQAILLHSLEDILRRFRSHSSPGFHRSTTNRRRFEHTLLRAKRTLQAKRAFHQDQLDSTPEPGRTGLVTHHTRAISQIDTLLDRLAQVQRLGRAEESHRKKA
ncbi:hypothetical protein EX895_004470 [Sporisorium graminicola]|uniref:Uncharacterized protein n=1 Tax=Sporisorium graminicola TaxID=280036 RepID=A0A4V6ETJ1_9BASI|nr:hypothetical protein EX895_004470 [Sporisorium graminicola]TKY86829.1 hypothetical protein EX895_004470 [Sporisorium graminicola]